MQEVIMDFNEEGDAVIAVKGVKGHGCKALTADLEAALGETVKDEPTREMRQTETKHAQKITNRR